ncbi:MAG: NYN domain-containing protein [Methanotrichaceae archaeon]
MIFIDNSNIFRGSRREDQKIDYQVLTTYLANYLANDPIGAYDLTRVIMYCTLDKSQRADKIEQQTRLYAKFNSFFKFDVKTFDLKLITDGNGNIKDKYEKGVDVALVTDLLLLASKNAFDAAIVCAGDADFIRAVEGVKEMGKEIYIASFDESCARSLRDAGLGYISLTNAADHIK